MSCVICSDHVCVAYILSPLHVHAPLHAFSMQTGPSQLEGLGDMLGQLDLGSEEGEDHFMKMMQGMMSTLLSKDVLYPSLVDLCKQVSPSPVQAGESFPCANR